MNIVTTASPAPQGVLPRRPQNGIFSREIGISSDWDKEIPAGYPHVKLFVIEGNLEIMVNGEPHAMQRGDFLDVINQPVRCRHASSDVRAFLLLLSEEFMSLTLREKRPFPPAYLMRILQNPVTRIPSSHFSTVIRGMEHVRQALAAGSGRFSQDILRSKVLIFILELADILADGPDTGLPSGNGKHPQIFIKFLQLLQTYICNEHTAGFYADQLHITPQYLRRIVKEITGHSVYQVISDHLCREICKLLLETDLSLQEIADRLHFSDQAVLSKFFKRINGVSPLKFRIEQR